ncbi:MAG: hypothetical protein V3R99_04560 [Thermoguttaceae bacterium]
MDTATVVESQIDDGRHFVDHLRQAGFDVAVAFWVLTTDDGLWFLYIASDVVDKEGLATAYRKAYSELSRSQVSWVTSSDIKLIGSQNPIALEAIASRSNNNMVTKYGGRKLGSMIIEDAYIYPN